METPGKVAFITGINGQDGSYLAEFLLSQNYVVHGLVRKASNFHTERLNDAMTGKYSSNLHLHYGDLVDTVRLIELIEIIQPNEIYNLAAQSHVRVSFEMPTLTNEITASGTLNLLEAIRITRVSTKFYQASSSEMFGDTPVPQNENSKMNPRSPYAAAKLHSHNLVNMYRDAYSIFAVSGILFNHESPRRQETFVTRKISKATAEIYLGLRTKIAFGNLDAKRDWGYAPEYVQAMWRMLQQDSPENFVISTGESFSVRDFLEFSFSHLNLDWEKYVEHDQIYERPLEVPHLLGDSNKAFSQMGWKAKTLAPKLAQIMVDADLKELSR